MDPLNDKARPAAQLLALAGVHLGPTAGLKVNGALIAASVSHAWVLLLGLRFTFQRLSVGKKGTLKRVQHFRGERCFSR